jgi:hypothetical protein
MADDSFGTLVDGQWAVVVQCNMSAGFGIDLNMARWEENNGTSRTTKGKIGAHNQSNP